MKKLRQRDILVEKINALRVQQEEHLESLKYQFHETYESFKPLNLIKSTFMDATKSPDVKNKLVDGALNLATGAISGNLLWGWTERPIKKVLSTAFNFVKNRFSKNKETLQNS
jgi:hypothetical protein